MKRSILLLVLGSLLLMAVPTVGAAAQQTRNFRAHLSAGEEVADPPVQSHATGQATFKLNKAGDALGYRLNVANIENVTAAHIHLAEAGANGPVVVGLYEGPAPGRTQGRLARGTITDADLKGPLAGQTLDDLLEAMEAGDAYVNVHTSQYPGGEIRGQIR